MNSNHIPIRWYNITNDGTISKDFKDRCPHCRNGSFVMPDDGPGNVAWPCPMCSVGRVRASEYATGKLIPSDSHAVSPRDPWSLSGRGGASFFDGMDLRGVSWERGLTLEHRHWCSVSGCENAVVRVGLCVSCDAAVKGLQIGAPDA